MNDQATYRKGLAVALLLLIFFIDLIAVYRLFPNVIQVSIFGAILGVQTLLVLAYHQRLLECEGCMEKGGSSVFLFYKIFATIGFFSMTIIFFSGVFPLGNSIIKIIASLAYAALLITGASSAFNAIIGKKKFHDKKKEPEKNSIELSAFEFFLKKIELKNYYIYILCATTFLLSIFFIDDFKLIMFFMLFISILAFLKANIFSFRLKKGWYANNYYEAKEAIKLIDENFDDYENNNSSGNFKIFPSYQPERSKSTIGIGEKP